MEHEALGTDGEVTTGLLAMEVAEIVIAGAVPHDGHG